MTLPDKALATLYRGALVHSDEAARMFAEAVARRREAAPLTARERTLIEALTQPGAKLVFVPQPRSAGSYACGGHRFREPTVRRLVAYGLIEAPDEFPTSV